MSWGKMVAEMNDKEFLAGRMRLKKIVPAMMAGEKPPGSNLEENPSPPVDDSDDDDEESFREFWDPDDAATWFQYRNTDYLRDLLPICTPMKAGKILCGNPVIELYRLEIRKLDGRRRQDFNMILLMNHSTRYVPVVIYKRPPPLPALPEEEEIDTIIGQSLPLNIPGRLPDAEFSFAIFLSGGWFFELDPERDEFKPKFKYNEHLSMVFKDNNSDSKASVSYEIIEQAAKAKLVFRFINEGGEEEGQPIQILSGTIYASHGGVKPDDATKRIVKQFPSHKQRTVVNTYHMLPVDRHVFGVPIGSKFYVTADLTCTTTLAGGGGEQGYSRCFRIHETLCFDMPTHSGSEDKLFNSTDSSSSTRLLLTVSWENSYM